MDFKNIAISGDIGTGKTTLAENLAEKLGWKHINAGDYFRKWHKENSIPLEESEKVPEDMDRAFDRDFANQMKTSKNTVFESRLAGWLARDLKKVYKILVITDFGEAMKRVANRDAISVEEAKKKAIERSSSHKEKFKKLYGAIDYLNPKYFNLVVDTINMSPQETLEYVLNAFPKTPANN